MAKTPRQWKVKVSGDLAEKMLTSQPELKWLDNIRQSIVVFVVATTDDASDQNSDAYQMEIMSLEDGTYPDMYCTEVTGKAWNLN